ncbi:hypothetical protein S83_070208 [Arachis hypogaea]
MRILLMKRHRVRHKFKKISMKSRNCVETGRYLVRKTVEEEAAASIRYLVRKRSSQRGRSGTKGKKQQQASEMKACYSNFIWQCLWYGYTQTSIRMDYEVYVGNSDMWLRYSVLHGNPQRQKFGNAG